MAKCVDCGCTCESNGMCSNCHEELFIMTFQADGETEFSDEFRETAEGQARELKQRVEEQPHERT